MQFLVDIIVAVLTAYLAFTNALAGGISSLLPEEIHSEGNKTTSEEYSGNAGETLSIRALKSDYGYDSSLPDILIKNAAYQRASVIDGTGEQNEEPASVTDALVNIFCTYTTDEYVRTNTGTGFFIDPDGVVLTNAHVAQFLILETVNGTGETECIIRGGNPATPLYEAELLYISPAWIKKHAKLITDERPRGTGERDYALLYISAGLDNKPMPAKFPSLNIDTKLLSTKMLGSKIVAAGYPAEAVHTEGPNVVLTPIAATTTLTDMFTFVSNYADIFSIAGSAVGERGASGGPVLNDDGNVIGLITTKGSAEEGSNTLRALTLSYINRTIIDESTIGLKEMTGGHLSLRARLFTETVVPFLSEILEAELE